MNIKSEVRTTLWLALTAITAFSTFQTTRAVYAAPMRECREAMAEVAVIDAAKDAARVALGDVRLP